VKKRLRHVAPAIVLFVSSIAAAEITRPELKCISPPAYFPGPGVQFTEDVANDCAALRVDMLRVEFIGEPDPDKSICYSAYDMIVDRAAARDMKVLGLIDYQSVAWSDASEWATSAFRQRFVERAEEIVAYYSTRDNPIRHWEIWNEEDICVTGFCVRIEPAPYAELLIDTYHAIKAIDPDAVVVFGGLSPKGFEYTENYLADFYATAAAQQHYAQYGYHPFDVVACHPYPETFTHPNPSLSNILNTRIKAVMNANGDAHKKVWLTEMGWNSYYVSENQQASYLSTSFGMMDTLTDPAYPEDGPYVERYFWFRYSDFGTIDKWGLKTADLSREKPAYGAFDALGPSGVTKPIPPPETAPPGVIQELATDQGLLSVLPDADDPLNGHVATRISGGFHPANTDPADQEAAFTDGAGLGPLTGLLNDYPGPQTPAWSGFWVLDDGLPVHLTELRVFSGNLDRDGRIYHHYDVYVTDDPAPGAASNWMPLYEEITPAQFGASNAAGVYEAASTRITPDGTLWLARAITGLRIDFFAVTSVYPDFNDDWPPCTAGDRDGAIAAYASPLIYEVDAYYRTALPDFDEDGDVDLSDYGTCYSGPANPPPLQECYVCDLDTDGDVDLGDYGAFLSCYNGPNNPLACQ
jgi:hypothetical protein